VKSHPFVSIVNPKLLVKKWEAGEIDREEFQRLMAQHQQALLEEAEVVLKNPIASYVDGIMNKRAAKKLMRQHSEAALRELFVALSDLEDFPLSSYLWNAMHWDVPLYCFMRLKRVPIFRVKDLWVKSDRAEMLVEHTDAKKPTKERFIFERQWRGQMKVIKRFYCL